MVAVGSYEWRVHLPLAEGRPKVKSKDIILITRLYLDADLVTEIARDSNTREVFIQNYPDKLQAHWLKINSDLQAFNKLMVQIKVLLLGLTSLISLSGLDKMEYLIPLLVGNIASFVFPKLFAKSMVFYGKLLFKTWNWITKKFFVLNTKKG